jgi:hypothetical protein
MSTFTVMVIDFMLEVLLFLAIVVVIYNIYLRHRLPQRNGRLCDSAVGISLPMTPGIGMTLMYAPSAPLVVGCLLSPHKLDFQMLI